MSFVLLILPMLAAGCAGATPAATVPPTTAPTATEATIPTSAVSDEQLAAAATVGDIAAGEDLFDTQVEGAPDSVKCSTCHSLDGKDSPDGPTLAGISAVAADRVDGMTDVDYLRQSIVDPYEFTIDGEWRFAMPYRYSDLLSEDEIDNLIAFLLTR